MNIQKAILAAQADLAFHIRRLPIDSLDYKCIQCRTATATTQCGNTQSDARFLAHAHQAREALIGIFDVLIGSFGLSARNDHRFRDLCDGGIQQTDTLFSPVTFGYLQFQIGFLLFQLPRTVTHL